MAVALFAAKDGPPPETLAKARASFEIAERAYRVGDFEIALANYRRAYELYPRPEFLFNIGQSQRSLEQWRDAIFSFELYLRDASDAPDRAEVQALIAELEREAEKEDELAIHNQWWFWAAAGAVTIAGVVTTAALVSRGDSAPTGSLATFDYR